MTADPDDGIAPSLVRAWAPILKGDSWPTVSLAVQCWTETPPTEKHYRDLLESRLESLIKADPRQARRDLEAVSTREHPGFYPELRWHPPREWAYLMMRSFEMDQLLNRIDWQADNPVQELPEEDLPAFIDFLEFI